MKGTKINIYLIIATLLMTMGRGSVWAATEEQFTEGNKAYEEGAYEEAARLYNTIIQNGEESWELYFNLGNAYYRMDSIGRSILSYERALRLSPAKKEIKENLALANSKTADRIESIPKLFLVEWFEKIVGIFSVGGWKMASIISMILLCSIVTMFVVSRDYRLRRGLFIGSLLMGIVVIISLTNMAYSVGRASKRTEAIVTSTQVIVKGSPDRKSVDKFVIHEGTKLKIKEEQDHWWRIEIGDGKNGWIDGGAERI